MADYFAALAARTLRPELSVQPRPRVRWEAAAEPMADAVPATEKSIADGTPPSVSDEREPFHRSRRKSTADPGPPENEPIALQPRQKRDKRKGAGDPEDTTVETASTPHPTVRALEPAVQVRFERVAARSGDVPNKSRTVAAERAGATARANGIERARPRPTGLSARDRESTAEPVIRIHIGRVDVRAVTTAVPASSRPAGDRERGLMSLDDYVQKRDRGVS